jgi:periplasmic protein TonB
MVVLKEHNEMNALPTTRSKADGERTLKVVRRQEVAAPRPTFASRQNVRLLIALSLLMSALAVVLIKDRDFWFGSEQTVESDSAPDSIAKNTTSAPAPAPAPAAAAAKPQAPAKAQTSASKHNAPKTQSHPAVTQTVKQPVPDQSAPFVATKRVVLPPLNVEVIAGDSHRTVRPGSNVAKVEIPAAPSALSTNAAERERLSTVSIPAGRQTIDANYPLLGQNARVQGSVVLQAVIGADGNVENLRVVSGPAILATAAQQAVRQWRFKPYLQNGQPVETKTRITVNFSIRVAGNFSTAS